MQEAESTGQEVFVLRAQESRAEEPQQVAVALVLAPAERADAAADGEREAGQRDIARPALRLYHECECQASSQLGLPTEEQTCQLPPTELKL